VKIKIKNDFFPGYTLIAALFPKKTQLDTIERVALSFGLSIAVVPLIGLILNYTPWGIRLYPILVSLTGFIVVMSAVAWIRRFYVLPPERLSININIDFSSFGTQSKLDKALTVILIGAIIAAIGTLRREKQKDTQNSLLWERKVMSFWV